MELIITKEAQIKIEQVSQVEDVLVLDFEDGMGPFVESGASCQLYPNFRLLLVPENFPKAELAVYDDCLETEMGKIWMKQTSERYLDKAVRLIVEKNYHRLQLTADSGVLAANVPIQRVMLENGQYKDKQDMGGHVSC